MVDPPRPRSVRGLVRPHPRQRLQGPAAPGSRLVARDISDELGLATADPYARTHERDAIDAALATLSPDHRVVVALRYDRDLAADEIARRLDIPVGTVHSRLHYALRKLHEVIDGFELEGTTR